MINKKILLGIIYFWGFLSIIFLYYFNPAEYSQIYPPSLSREWGGFYCAGCGTLRALHQLLHGNWRAALRFNPLLIICLPYCFYLVLPYFLQYFYQLNLYTIKYKNRQLLIMTIMFIVYGFLRNIAFFWWLAPPA